ncbi:MAG: hypothetical protein Ct9H300mP16_16480 [Pseudomonadota bacterium]|nr:MAG: hypothetical protein Ct9H300mP16_16480 [Pseudomonadota bacterium]
MFRAKSGIQARLGAAGTTKRFECVIDGCTDKVFGRLKATATRYAEKWWSFCPAAATRVRIRKTARISFCVCSVITCRRLQLHRLGPGSRWTEKDYYGPAA